MTPPRPDCQTAIPAAADVRLAASTRATYAAETPTRSVRTAVAAAVAIAMRKRPARSAVTPDVREATERPLPRDPPSR